MVVKHVLCEANRGAAQVLLFFDELTGANDEPALSAGNLATGATPQTGATRILRNSFASDEHISREQAVCSNFVGSNHPPQPNFFCVKNFGTPRNHPNLWFSLKLIEARNAGAPCEELIAVQLGNEKRGEKSERAWPSPGSRHISFSCAIHRQRAKGIWENALFPFAQFAGVPFGRVNGRHARNRMVFPLQL